MDEWIVSVIKAMYEDASDKDEGEWEGSKQSRSQEFGVGGALKFAGGADL